MTSRTVAMVVALAWLLPAGAGAQVRPLDPASLDPGLASQIAAILADKATRTPVERKIGSRLLYKRRMMRGRHAAPGSPTLRTGVQVDAEGRVDVDIRGGITPALLQRIRARGGRILHMSRRLGAIRARVAVEDLEAIAELDEVRRVRTAGGAFTRKVDTSEGDFAHRADQLRSTHTIDGSGVTVGVLSDGVDNLATAIASGDVPVGTTVLPGQAGSGQEGTAMLEIIHDLAPGATLLFATAFTSQASFADNILALRAAGADIIVDDVGYFAEAAFQDDDVAAAVDAVVADGALYFSAAGNAGNLNDGTSGTWQGDFTVGETIDGFQAKDFGGDSQNEIEEASLAVYTLQWADALGASGNDYDLFITNHSSTSVFAASTDAQNGNDDPIEIIGGLPEDQGRHLLVIRYSGADRALQLKSFGGEFEFATDGEISGHPAARGAVAVAASDWFFAGGAGGAFDGSESVEAFSSDGPRRIHFEADGSAITPGDFSMAGGELRAKPDVTGADCVSTSTPGFAVFCGTSAAAPHVAAITALLWELATADGARPEDLRAVLSSTALDIEAAGADRDSGAGIVNALAAGNALAASCNNGLDDDGDGDVDTADVGCDDAGDASERSTTRLCDNGIDDDGDGLTDLDDDGCLEPGWPLEDPLCSNTLDDDGDGGVDWNGLDLNGDLDFDDPGEAPPDAECGGKAYQNGEAPSSCGVGPELLPLFFGLAVARRLRRRPVETRISRRVPAGS